MNNYSRLTSNPTKEAIEQAKKFPDGYVYVIDEKYKGCKDVPPKGILGAWKVNSYGIIIGSFIPNPNYQNKLS